MFARHAGMKRDDVEIVNERPIQKGQLTVASAAYFAVGQNEPGGTAQGFRNNVFLGCWIARLFAPDALRHTSQIVTGITVIRSAYTRPRALNQRHAAKSPHEQENPKRQVDATDRQIDKLVYELYGLTDEEIKIVEQYFESDPKSFLGGLYLVG